MLIHSRGCFSSHILAISRPVNPGERRRSGEKYFSVGIKTGFFYSSHTRDALTQGMCFWCGKTLVGRCFAIKLRDNFFCWHVYAYWGVSSASFCLKQAGWMWMRDRIEKGVKIKWNRFSNGRNSGFLSDQALLKDEKRYSFALGTPLSLKLFVFVETNPNINKLLQL